MSAFMHDSAHIDALVHAAFRFSRFGLSWERKASVGSGMTYEQLKSYDYDGATRIGRMLLVENAESVAHRYNMKDLDNDADDGTRPIEYLGYLDQADSYSYNIDDTRKPWRTLPAVAILKALASYEYQSCEHPGWSESEARSFCDSLRHELIGALPGYDAADTWCIYDHEVVAS